MDDERFPLNDKMRVDQNTHKLENRLFRLVFEFFLSAIVNFQLFRQPRKKNVCMLLSSVRTGVFCEMN
jgi:hypothetical protein